MIISGSALLQLWELKWEMKCALFLGIGDGGKEIEIIFFMLIN